MPILSCYVDQRTLMALERVSAETGRGIEELAEAAISDAASKVSPPSPSTPHGERRE